MGWIDKWMEFKSAHRKNRRMWLLPFITRYIKWPSPAKANQRFCLLTDQQEERQGLVTIKINRDVVMVVHPCRKKSRRHCYYKRKKYKTVYCVLGIEKHNPGRWPEAYRRYEDSRMLHSTLKKPECRTPFTISIPWCMEIVVCSLHFTFSLYFNPDLQSTICGLQSAFYTDRLSEALEPRLFPPKERSMMPTPVYHRLPFPGELLNKNGDQTRINQGFWYHVWCSWQNATIVISVKVSFRLHLKKWW